MRQEDKLDFADVSAPRTTLSFKNQCALLTWESPSNFGQLIVIQTVLFVLFCGIYLCVIEKWYSDPGDCHTRKADWFTMTGDSINPNYRLSA